MGVRRAVGFRHRRAFCGDVARAHELLDQALGTARELGLGTVERRAVAMLGAHP